MTDTLSDLLAMAADRRLAPFLSSPSAAFVFEPQGRQVLWGNAAGLDAAGERSLTSLRARQPERDQGFAEEIARAAALAPEVEPGRIDLIRFPWEMRRGLVPCRARRLGLPEGRAGLLLIMADGLARGPHWPLSEALIRLFPDAPAAVLDLRGGLAGAAAALDPRTAAALAGPLGPALVHAASPDRAAIVEHALPDRVLRLTAIRVAGAGAEAVLAVLTGVEPRTPRPLLVSVEDNPRPAERRILPFRIGRPFMREAAGRGQDVLLEKREAKPGGTAWEASRPSAAGCPSEAEAFLFQLPLALVVFRDAEPLFATRAFLDLTGHASVEAFAQAGGLDAFLPDRPGATLVKALKSDGSPLVLDARLFAVPWPGGQAMALALEPVRAEQSRAEAAARRICDVLAGISREIRTPLNTVLGLSELMFRERFGPLGDERYRGHLRDMLTSGSHMLSLLDGLLELAAIEAGRTDLAFTRLVVNDLVRGCAALMQPQADRAQIIIRLGLARGVATIRADQPSLRRIVLTLLANAVAATRPGGQVIISTAVGADGEVAIRVRDVGAGPALDLVKALAEANQAQFSVMTEPGLGSLAEILFRPWGEDVRR